MGALKARLAGVIERSPILFRAYEVHSFRTHRPRIEELARAGTLRLHLGCGAHLLPGWVNVDLAVSSELLAARLPRGLRRFSDASVRSIYASHVLEHVEYPGEARDFVCECHRILVPGGVLRIVVPDIELIIDAYARDDKDFFAIQARFHPHWCETKLEHLMYALQQDGAHKYGYDFATLEKLLAAARFARVVHSDVHASEFEDLRVDYREARDNRGNDLSLYVDAVK